MRHVELLSATAHRCAVPTTSCQTRKRSRMVSRYWWADRQWRRGRNRLQTVLNGSRKPWACSADLNRWRTRSRLRTGRMRVLGAVVQALVASVLRRREYAFDSRHVAGELIGDDHPWLAVSRCEHASQERDGRLFVTALLNEDVEHEPVLIDGSPQPVLPSADLQPHLVDVPLVGRAGPPPTELLGVGRPELAAREANGLAADLDVTLGEQLFNVSMAQVEPKVQPDGVADDLGRKAMAAIQGGRRPLPDPTRPAPG